MDYIFKEWQDRLSQFESSVKKDLAEIRQCKAEVQQMTCEGTAGSGMVKAVVKGDMSLVGPRP
jgi:DNA-binding protein YbaB